ncbi:MAG: RNA polymerase sigma factor [Polyangiaceae bacterium]
MVASSEEELLSLAASRDAAELDVRRAQAEFYERHVRYLYGVLKRREGVLARVGGLAVEDLVQETFQRAFLYGGSFRGGSAEDGPDRQRLRVRAWLGRIAENLVRDALSRNQERAATPFVELQSTEDLEPAPPSSPELRAVREGLEQLSEREQDVLRVTALYQRMDNGQDRLPNAVAAELATRWGTNNQNIRAIRSRAMKKLESIVAALVGGGK